MAQTKPRISFVILLWAIIFTIFGASSGNLINHLFLREFLLKISQLLISQSISSLLYTDVYRVQLKLYIATITIIFSLISFFFLQRIVKSETSVFTRITLSIHQITIATYIYLASLFGLLAYKYLIALILYL
jgi:hypothetical protein